MFLRLSFLLVTIGAISSIGLAQADQPQKDAPNQPQVTFELTWRAANPQWFQVAIDSAGHATYQSQPHTEPNETPVNAPSPRHPTTIMSAIVDSLTSVETVGPCTTTLSTIGGLWSAVLSATALRAASRICLALASCRSK